MANRREYHATEFVAFNGMLRSYFVATGDRLAAGKHLEMIRDILPDHPAVQVLEAMILRETFRRPSPRSAPCPSA